MDFEHKNSLDMTESLMSERSGAELTEINKSAKRRKFESPPVIKDAAEEVLETHEGTPKKLTERGVTGAVFVELKDDGSGIFKESDFYYERAAYLVDRFLNLGLIPPTVIRNIAGKTGSLQKFIEDAKTPHEVEDRAQFEKSCEEQLMQMWVLDLIIQNYDRHGGNILIKNGRVYAIDHGYSMRRFEGYQDFDERDPGKYVSSYKSYYGKKFPQELIKNLESFVATPQLKILLAELLTELVGEKEAMTCINRIVYLTEVVKKLGFIPKPQYPSW